METITKISISLVSIIGGFVVLMIGLDIWGQGDNDTKAHLMMLASLILTMSGIQLLWDTMEDLNHDK